MVVVTVDVSWSSDFAMVFDDAEKASQYIKEQFKEYQDKPMFDHDPVSAYCDDEYAYVVWQKNELYVIWKLYGAEEG